MQLTFGDAEAMGKRKRTRKEIFLAEMDKVRDLPDRLNLEFFRVSFAHGHSCCCRGLWLQGVYETRGDSVRLPPGLGKLMVFDAALLVTALTRPRDMRFPAVVPCGGMAATASTVLQTAFRMSSLPARLSKGRPESVNTAGDIGAALQKMLWLLLLALGGLLPPSSALAVEPALERCSEFLSNLPGDGGEAEVSFDLEVQLGLAAAHEAYPTYRSIEPLNSGCETGNIIAHHPEEAMQPANLPSYVDVAAGVSGAYRWVQFIYPSVGEHGPGLESSVVFYDAKGVPGLTRLVSAYHSWEGASVLRSVMSQGRIKHCRRQIEFFSYTEDGDIAAELDAPVSSDCEYSWSTYPWR